jgi:tRNA dimethylallyltransferase
MNKLLIICGPTATGKTALAVTLAKKFNGELISADSRQVYRGMDIGTGKDTESLQGIPIWMYDVADPDEPFNSSLYQEKANACIADILKRNKLPIVVGGSGLYVNAILHPLTISVEPNERLRKKLESYTKKELQKKLFKVGREYWESMNHSDRENPRRLIRKIEIAMGKKKKPVEKKNSYDVLKIGLTGDNKTLYARIDERVEKRVLQGMVQEIRTLSDKGYPWNLASMSGLGYRQWEAYFDGTKTKETVIQKWKFDEHGYARRQMTWFRKDKDIHWFDITKKEKEAEIESLVASWYTLPT